MLGQVVPGDTNIYWENYSTNPFSIDDRYVIPKLPLSDKPQTIYTFDLWNDINQNLSTIYLRKLQVSSSTQEVLLNTEEDKVQELISQIRESHHIRCHEILANRLITLFNDAKEEDPDRIGIVVDSLRNFNNFFRLHTKLKCPIISLTPDNNIYASWRAEKNRLFSVHFLQDNNVHFVLFQPNERHPSQQIRLSGIATIDVLLEKVAPHNICDWITE